MGNASVTPGEEFFGSADGVLVRFTFSAPGPTDVAVRIVGGKDAREYVMKQLEPGTQHELSWDGLTDDRKAATDGRYRVLVRAAGSEAAEAGRVTLRGHRFPIRGPHRLRGAVGSFGAPRNGGRIHRGLDVLARCGTPLVATRAGTVVRKRSNPRLDGNYVVISMAKERMTYRYSHLSRPAKAAVGDRVFTGQVLGYVGKTGNAASTPCHLHIELRKRGAGFVNPQPILRRWDRFS